MHGHVDCNTACPLATPVPGVHAGLSSGAKLSARMALGMTVTRLGAMHARSTVFSLAVCDTQITCRPPCWLVCIALFNRGMTASLELQHLTCHG